MSTTVSLVNMKGGVGKTTLAFNLAWYSAWQPGIRVLSVDLDPQANLSQYLMGARDYIAHLDSEGATVSEVFEQYTPPRRNQGSVTPLSPSELIYAVREWEDDSVLHLIPSSLELAWTLRNPTEKAQLLPQFLSSISDEYDLIIIDCPPTESILTTAAYLSSRYIIVPVKPEFLATIGLPLLARSIEEFRMKHQNQTLEMAGIVFNDKSRTNIPPEQNRSVRDVTKLAHKFRWPVFENEVYHSNSYPAGSRKATPIFGTSYARGDVKAEFRQVGEEFLKAVGLK